jgi:purine-nucleoside phosphorylase
MRGAAHGDFARVQQAARWIARRIRRVPGLAIVLGSGLGDFAEQLGQAVRLPYASIPHFPRPGVVGHRGQLVVGELEGVPVAVLQGRVHYYEGYTLQQVVFPVRVLGLLGVRVLVLTNAAGGIRTDYGQGALVLIRDHLNLQGANPLMGPHDERFGPRFPDMTHAYSERLRQLARAEARRLGIELPEGVYAAVHGPSYETPAEIRALRTLGADLVGMSTVPEAIAARQMGLEVLAISCVTNLAAGLADAPIDHEEVLRTGAAVREKLMRLLAALVRRLGAPAAEVVPAKKNQARGSRR